MTVSEECGLRVLTTEECLALLPTVPVGRVVVTLHALPAALPVHFTLVGRSIVFRTSPGTKLSAALDEAVVAFEADAFDAGQRSGWSVLVQGIARVVADEEDPRWRAAQEIDAWGTVGARYVTAISVDMVSGRAVGAGAAGSHPRAGHR